MKQVILFLTALILFSPFVMNAQKSEKNEKKVEENYARNSITYFLLDFGNEKYSEIIKSSFDDINITGKFDDNNEFFANRVINAPFKRIVKNNSNKMKKSLLKQFKSKELYQPDSIDNILNDYLLKNKYANNLIYKWWQIEPDGSFPEDFANSIIAKRGLYNATDVDYNVARAKKIGMADLTNAGAGLIDNSHLLFFDYSDIITMKEYYDNLDKNNEKKAERKMNGYKGKVTVYLFKLNYNEIAQGSFDKSFNEENKFDKNTFESYYKDEPNPIKFIVKVDAEVSGIQHNADQPQMKDKKQITKEGLFNQLVNDGVDQVIFKITRAYETFKVKSPLVYKKKTIGAKIGKKEGLKIDQRYFVYEYKAEADDEGNITDGEFKRRGVCRAKLVIDNTELKLGKTDTSLYYQVAGRNLDNGWIMQQNEDLGFGISLGYSLGQIGGLNGRIEYNSTQLLNEFFSFPVTSLKLWADIGFQSKEYGNEENVWIGKDDFSFLRYTFGLSKDFYFARNFHITPFVGYGLEKVTWEELEGEEGIQTSLLDAGMRLSINILYNIQAVTSINYYMPMGDLTWTDKDGEVNEFVGDTPAWADIFTDRKGVSLNIGIRYQF
jgi:hypothetical protein